MSRAPKTSHTVTQTHRFQSWVVDPGGDGNGSAFTAIQSQEFWLVGPEWGASIHLREWEIPALIAVLVAAQGESL